MGGGATLDGVGHGTLFAGRYRLQERVRSGADGSLWRAVDETLDRPVSIRVVRPGHRYTADVVDAARRAVLVEDARLVRVLDVGETGGSAFIVSEHLLGRTLAELIAEAPLAPEIARRLVGEAAEALQRASARGLHHLRLSTESLVVIPNGTVKVLGTAVEAALAGVDHHEDPVSADRMDAVGLVRLLYAGLVGRWQGSGDPLGATPPATARVVPPADLVAGIPNDLDTLCAVTLGPHDDGPNSPGELAQQLAPWAAAEPLTTSGASALVDASSSASSATSSIPAGIGLTGTASAQPDSRFDSTPATSGAAPTPVATASPTLLPRGPDGPAATDDWALLSRPASTTRNPAQPASGEPEPLGPFIPPAPITRPPQDQTRFVLGLVAALVVLGLILAIFSLRGLFGTPKRLVQPTPLLPPSATAADTTAGAAPPVTMPTTPGPTPTTASASPSPTQPPAEITGIQAIDPQGDGDENGSTADRAIDDNPSTTWRSARYSTAAFGGLKQGLGLFLQFSSGSISTVTVGMSGTNGTVELRTTLGPGLEGSTVVATATGEGGEAVLTPDTPVSSGPLLLWFTQLPRQSNGEHRLVVSEITAS